MSTQILDATRLPWPAGWAALFGREAPLVVEIGFGNGQFLLELARSRPGANVIGMEISEPSLQKAARKANKAGLDNVRVLKANARMALWALCEPVSIREIYINFPDPWPKEAHHHRRLVDDRFLRLVATRVPAGACLDIATDHAGYATVIKDALVRSAYFESRLPVPLITGDDQRIRTKYEQIALDAGHTCHYFKWQRNQLPAPDHFPIPPELPMPHAILQSPLSLDEIRDRFATSDRTEGETSVRFVGVFQSPRDGFLLVDTFINEEPMSQRVALTIRPRHGDEIILGLHELGFPRPTAGVHLAIHLLARWIETLHPEIRIEKSNLQVKP